MSDPNSQEVKYKVKKEVKDIFEDAGFKKEEPINFGLILKSKKIQRVLQSLKDYPPEKVFEFVEGQLNKWKDQKIERRIQLRDIYEDKSLNQPEEANHDSKSYFLKTNDELEKRYEEEVVHDLKKTMVWFRDNVQNQDLENLRGR